MHGSMNIKLTMNTRSDEAMLFSEINAVVEPTIRKFFVPLHAMKTWGSGDITPFINLDTR